MFAYGMANLGIFIRNLVRAGKSCRAALGFGQGQQVLPHRIERPV
jgi:hypothetical protein